MHIKATHLQYLFLAYQHHAVSILDFQNQMFIVIAKRRHTTHTHTILHTFYMLADKMNAPLPTYSPGFCMQAKHHCWHLLLHVMREWPFPKSCMHESVCVFHLLHCVIFGSTLSKMVNFIQILFFTLAEVIRSKCIFWSCVFSVTGKVAVPNYLQFLNVKMKEVRASRK